MVSYMSLARTMVRGGKKKKGKKLISLPAIASPERERTCSSALPSRPYMVCCCCLVSGFLRVLWCGETRARGRMGEGGRGGEGVRGLKVL